MLILGQEEARLLGHCEFGSDHLLLGILRLPDDRFMPSPPDASGDQAAASLLALGVTLEAARQAVVALRGHVEGATRGLLPFSNDGREALTDGMKTALSLNSKNIEPAHFLLGMITRETDSTAARVLDRLGVGRDQFRQTLEG